MLLEPIIKMFETIIKFFTIALLITAFNRCSNDINEMSTLDSVELRVRIIPEDTIGGYVLEWDDGINPTGANEKDKFRIRPYELYCTITSSTSDTLAYYIGSSSPRNYLGFVVNPKDENEIFLQFQIGINHFSSYLEQQDEKYIEKFNRIASNFPKYEIQSFDLSSQTYNWMNLKLHKTDNN